MADQLNVDPAVLDQAAKGITSIINQLSDIGVKETGAMGRGFAMLSLSPMEAGKASVQAGFETFCERWSWGVRALVQAANNMAQSVGLSAGRYQMMDDQFSNMFKQMYTHLAGNPHLSTEEINARGWGDTLADNSFNHIRNADYSTESFDTMLAKMQTNGQVIDAVGGQALNNVFSTYNPNAGWNTGAAQQAAEIMSAAENGKGGK
ncbi:hypothetical protein JK358_32830 [Nocardia sp. 2]|uniref:Excreted virulence factor EspC (Type VII ESX diderm) n=1 Tax=Nocardia acididurans TaxID=2802282 RepID=A0ABS1MEX2_9NOCA|nr:hypothetical protein [Nocardia acididurans]MBL1079201.1 hypothetical protein [Nocardia acididurans]